MFIIAIFCWLIVALGVWAGWIVFTDALDRRAQRRAREQGNELRRRLGY